MSTVTRNMRTMPADGRTRNLGPETPPTEPSCPGPLITHMHMLSSERETFIQFEPLLFVLLGSSQTQILNNTKTIKGRGN